VAVPLSLICILPISLTPWIVTPSPTLTTLISEIFLPARMRSKIIRDKNFDLVAPYYERRIYPEEIKDEASNLVMTFRPVMCRDLEKAGCLKGSRLIYSLWPGYLERGKHDIREWCSEHGVHFEIRHTSGHAGISDMKKLVDRTFPLLRRKSSIITDRLGLSEFQIADLAGCPFQRLVAKVPHPGNYFSVAFAFQGSFDFN